MHVIMAVCSLSGSSHVHNVDQTVEKHQIYMEEFRAQLMPVIGARDSMMPV